MDSKFATYAVDVPAWWRTLRRIWTASLVPPAHVDIVYTWVWTCVLHADHVYEWVQKYMLQWLPWSHLLM